MYTIIKQRQNILIITTLVLLIIMTSVSKASASSPTPISKLIIIHIDEDNKIFWNSWHEIDSLPKLIHSDKIYDDSEDYSFPLSELSKLLIDKTKNRNIRGILIIPHPDSHYMTLKNILFLIDQAIIENYFPTAKYGKNDIDSLKIDFGSKIGGVIQKWELRDSNVINATYRRFDIIKRSNISLPDENKMASHWNSDITKNHIIKFEWYTPGMVNPKIGIPKYIHNDEPIIKE